MSILRDELWSQREIYQAALLRSSFGKHVYIFVIILERCFFEILLYLTFYVKISSTFQEKTTLLVSNNVSMTDMNSIERIYPLLSSIPWKIRHKYLFSSDPILS